MSETPIQEYIDRTGITQTELAKRLGVSQGSVNEMLNPRNGGPPRDIYIVESEDGLRAVEHRQIPVRSQAR